MHSSVPGMYNNSPRYELPHPLSVSLTDTFCMKGQKLCGAIK
jgi:hypothetical protein